MISDEEGFSHETGAAARYGLWYPLKFVIASEEFVPPAPGAARFFDIMIPLWLTLLLVLIGPVRWLIARPANAPAFPVITDTKQKRGQ